MNVKLHRPKRKMGLYKVMSYVFIFFVRKYKDLLPLYIIKWKHYWKKYNN